MRRRCGRSARGKSSEATGKFSPRALRPTDAASMAPNDVVRAAASSNVRRLLSGRGRCSNRCRRVASPSPASARLRTRSTEPMAPDSARDDPVGAVSEEGEAVVVHLVGELDLYNAPALRKALLECVERKP